MSSLERRLQETLVGADAEPAASDLFQRVSHSIEADRDHRRRRRRLAGSWLLVLGAVATAAVPFTSYNDGRLVMPWWLLEIATTTILIGLALWLGPFIKRFGRAYAADVFHDNPLTGKSYIVLTDIVYYLIFTSYILFTVQLRPTPASQQSVNAALVETELRRVGGILLIIGILHGLNIVLMPVLGRVFSLNRRLPDSTSRLRSVREDDELG